MKFFVVFFLLGQTLLFAISDKALGITIDLAGKQRMLTQRMAKESLLILMDYQAESNRKKLSSDVQLFDKTLKGLIGGDKDLKLEAVKDAKIQAQLQKVSKLFAPFKRSTQSIIDGSATDEDYNQVVLKKNLILLKEMNKAVYMYTALSNDPANRGLKMATNINLAGKQRMLTQRMAKDLLIAAMAASSDRTPYMKDFNTSRTLFGRTLRGLTGGDAQLHLVKTTLPDIRDQLEKVQALWKLKQRIFDQAMAQRSELYHAVSGLDTLMKEMNTAVKLYTRSIVRQKLRRRLSSIVGAFVEEKNVLRKLVNISGKQRMLTQRISKLALQCALGLNREKSCMAMQTYRKEYARAIVLFVKGDKNKGVPPTKDKKALVQIKKIITLWQPFAKQVQTLSETRGKDKAALLYILKHEHTLLTASDRLVKIYEQSDTTQDPLQKARLRVVNVAGRQRMLTQKMSKEKLLWQKLGSAKQKQKMLQTIALFESSLRGLIHGDTKMGLPKVSNPKIKTQLKKVEGLWKKVKTLYIKEKLSPEGLAMLIKANPILLREMHRAVGMMEQEVEY